MQQDPNSLPALDGISPEMAAGLGGAAFTVSLTIICVVLVVAFVISVVTCFLIYKPFSKLPESFRPFQPGLVFLMLVPIANLVMPFMISISVTDGFKRYFESVGDNSKGDCGKSIGLAWAIGLVCSLIPLVNYIAGPISLVCMIIFIVKLWSLGNAIESSQKA